MRCEYPDFALIERVFANAIQEDLEQKKMEVADNGSSISLFVPDFEMETFRQTFPNTAGLLSADGCFAGQGFTDYYITVVYEHETCIHGIFQGNKLAYLLKNAPSDDFWKDLAIHELQPIDVAMDRYA